MVNKKSNNAFSIVELLIALALISIVLAVVFSQFFFGLFTFSKGEAQSRIQYDLRMAGAEVTNLIQNSTEISIIDISGFDEANPNFGTDNKYEYLWINANGELVHTTFANNPGVSLTSGIIDATNTTFFITYESRYFFRFALTGKESTSGNDQIFSVESSVLLNNIPKESTGLNSGKIVRFKRPD